VQRPVGRQVRDRRPALEIRIDADERFRPEAIRRVDLLDLRKDVVRTYLSEGTRKALVVAYKRTVQVKYVHDISPGMEALGPILISKSHAGRKAAQAIIGAVHQGAGHEK
jgi:hypothetical protein